MNEQHELQNKIQHEINHIESAMGLFTKYGDQSVKDIDLKKCYDVPYLLHRKMVDETECILCLSKNRHYLGIPIHARAVFEAFVQANYLLKNLDACIHYVLFEGVQAKKWTEDTIKTIDPKLKKSGFKESLPTEIFEALKKQIIEQEDYIKHYSHGGKILKVKKKGNKDVYPKTWYENYANIQNLAFLSEDVGKISSYAVDYFTWSRSAHASAVYHEYEPRLENDVYYINQSKKLDITVINNIINARLLHLENTQLLLKVFKPNLLVEFERSYIEATSKYHK